MNCLFKCNKQSLWPGFTNTHPPTPPPTKNSFFFFFIHLILNVGSIAISQIGSKLIVTRGQSFSRGLTSVQTHNFLKHNLEGAFF
jgi:hypothetical protein